jgi:hypothetical protein
VRRVEKVQRRPPPPPPPHPRHPPPLRTCIPRVPRDQAACSIRRHLVPCTRSGTTRLAPYAPPLRQQREEAMAPRRSWPRPVGTSHSPPPTPAPRPALSGAWVRKARRARARVRDVLDRFTAPVPRPASIHGLPPPPQDAGPPPPPHRPRPPPRPPTLSRRLAAARGSRGDWRTCQWGGRAEGSSEEGGKEHYPRMVSRKLRTEVSEAVRRDLWLFAAGTPLLTAQTGPASRCGLPSTVGVRRLPAEDGPSFFLQRELRSETDGGHRWVTGGSWPALSWGCCWSPSTLGVDGGIRRVGRKSAGSKQVWSVGGREMGH